jgi:hypothetical protein
VTNADEIRARYASRLANNEEDRAQQLAGHQEVREAFTDTTMLLEDVLPAGRYKDFAMTALEEAAMWANKSVASPYPIVAAHKEGRQSLEQERLREGTQGLDAQTEGFSEWGRTAETPKLVDGSNELEG